MSRDGSGEYQTGPYINVTFPYEGTAVWIRVCEKCGRYVKFDEAIGVNMMGDFKGNTDDKTVATCKRCGRVEALFTGWFSQEELQG